MKVYEAIVGELRRQGVTCAFGLVGSETLKLTVELDQRGIRYFNSRHDSAAVGMADGYARVTGNIGVAVVERGPGFTNALTALVSASKAGSPVIAFAGDAATGLAGPTVARIAAQHAKHVDQAGVAEAAGIRQVTLRSPGSAVADIAAVFELARAGATVLVNLPADVQEATAGDEPARVELRPLPPRTAPDPKAIAQVADLLEATWAAQRPVIIAGRGAVRADAKPVLMDLGQTCGALMATTLLARSFFAGDRYDVGLTGTLSTPIASELLSQADVVLAFGASLNRLQTLDGQLFPRARVVQFDIDPQAFDRWLRPPDLAVIGDVGLASAALLRELARRDHRSHGYRTPEIAERIAAAGSVGSGENTGAPGALDPRALRLRLDEVLPKSRRIVCDVGWHTTFTASYLTVPDPSSWICFTDCSALGSAPGVALGAAIAQPGRLTILAIGDGGLMMTLGELETAVRYSVPLVILVMNDAAYGAELQAMQAQGLHDRTARFPDLPFESIARALGADAATVRTMEDIGALAGRCERLQGPLLIDCKVSTGVGDEAAVQMHHRLSDPRQVAVASRA